jgi:hypothetical protein
MDSLSEKVGYQERLRRSRKMHSLVSKLLRLKKAKQSRFASKTELKKRAQRLAKILIRKRLAGVSGTQYHQMSLSQRIQVDKLVDALPKARISKLAIKLVPVVTKAEQERLEAYKKSHSKLNESKAKSKKEKRKELLKKTRFSHGKHKDEVGDAQRDVRDYQEEYNLDEAISIATRRNRGETLKRKRHLIKRGAYTSRHRRRPKGHSRSTSRLSRQVRAQHLGVRVDLNKLSPDQRRVVQNMIDKGETHGKIRDFLKKLENRAELTRLSTPANSRELKTKSRSRTYGLNNSYDPLEPIIEEYIFETDMHKFDRLFMQGLVSKDNLHLYRRIFKNLHDSIKFARYRKDIVKILDRLVDLITDNNGIYQRIRQELQRGK